MAFDLDNFLAHYASEYYDPVKAREYYLRTRKLKGRDALSKNQSKVLAVTRDNINRKQNSALKKEAGDLKKQSKTAQSKANAKIAEISSKVDTFFKEAKDQPAIPEDASPRVRALLETKQANAEREAIGSGYKDVKKAGTEMRAAISKARERYAARTKKINTKYKKALKTETKNIRTKVR